MTVFMFSKGKSSRALTASLNLPLLYFNANYRTDQTPFGMIRHENSASLRFHKGLRNLPMRLFRLYIKVDLNWIILKNFKISASTRRS
ncbi:MAG: hypothetical protein K2O14_10635, partial [Oscillospiraceae bacterium]|nr:hypothetical protein [Oscillospiraceae bacterium]